jgi:T5SS/PEP-CTERM-associated repeat protein
MQAIPPSTIHRRTHLTLHLTLLLLLASLVLATPTFADIEVTGSVSPSDPTTWDYMTRVKVRGTVAVTDGSVVTSSELEIEAYEWEAGMVTIDGAGSMWECDRWLNLGGYLAGGHGALEITQGGSASVGYTIEMGYSVDTEGTVTVDGEGSSLSGDSSIIVGGFGDGTLNISNGGHVEAYFDTWAGAYGGNGVIHFDGGTLTTGSLLAGKRQLTGTGTINTNGIVVDGDLRIDSPDDLVQTIVYDDLPGQNIAIHLDLDSYRAEMGSLGSGYDGEGSLVIADGMQVVSSSGRVGYQAEASGEAMVQGIGTQWATRTLSVGCEGYGALTIRDGATVSSGVEFSDVGLSVDLRSGRGSFVNMATGGTLALYGRADGSLEEFFELVGGTDEIRYWDVVAGDWAHLSGATYGDDYTLEYLTEGEFEGYTALTVGRALGDFDGDRTIGASDIDAISAAIRNGVSSPEFDLDGDGVVDADDRTFLIEHLVSTPFGSGTAVADFDLDGLVGLLDLAILGDGYHLGNGWSTGDADGDGIVGLLDLAHLGENYNFDGTGIPEPMMLSLLAAGAVGLLRRRHEILNTRERGATFPALRRILIRGQRSGGALPATTSPDIQTWG